MRPPLSLRLPPLGLKQLNVNGVDSLRTMWSPHHFVSMNSTQALIDANQPKHEPTRRRWEARTDPLWWNCLTSRQVSTKRVVRGWLNRRARVAFSNALNRSGYDTNGYRLDGGSATEGTKPDLVGSVQFLTKSQLLHTSWTDLEAQADKVVAEVELKLSRLSQNPQKAPENSNQQKKRWKT